MDRQQLRDKLQQLDAELRQVTSIDEADREALKKLEADIRALLDSPDSTETQPYSRFGEGLRESVERLEARYPNLAMVMGQLAEMLSKMGI